MGAAVQKTVGDRWTFHAASDYIFFTSPWVAHAEFGALVAGRPLIRREYALIDETAIWKQILLHTGEI